MTPWGLVPTPSRPTGLPVYGCHGCGAVWVPPDTLREILDGAARDAFVDAATQGTPGAAVRRRGLPPGIANRVVVYRRCPTCDQAMARRNFAGISGVIVDRCPRHGTFFDAGELENILEFVRTGGLELARKKRERRGPPSRFSDRGIGSVYRAAPMSAGGVGVAPDWAVAIGFVRWAIRWVRERVP